MKRSKKSLKHLNSQTVNILHWIGFSVFVCAIILLTAYGFSQSVRQNSIAFRSADEGVPLSFVGVALSNNLGTGASRAHDIPVQLPESVIPVQNALLNESLTSRTFYDEHFTALVKHQELLKLDVVEYLRQSDDKAAALDRYIGELTESLAEVSQSRDSLLSISNANATARDALTAQIKNTELRIQTAYKQRNSDGIIEGLEDLEEMTKQRDHHAYGATFATQIAREYTILGNAMNERIVVLKANTSPLVAGVTVKLPAGVTIDTLKDLQLFEQISK